MVERELMKLARGAEAGLCLPDSRRQGCQPPRRVLAGCEPRVH